MSENIDVNVNVNTNKAQQNLTQLNQKLNGLGKSLDGLKAALGGIAIASFAANMLKFADSIVDVSKATNIATRNILAFQTAVQANGGSIEQANTALLNLIQSIGEANDGSLKTQQAFASVGVTLEDLKNASEEQIFLQVVQGLSQIDDTSKRASVSMDIFKKAMKGVDAKGTAEDLRLTTEEMKKYESAIKSAEATQARLEYAFNKFKLELLKTLEPLTKFLEKLDKETIDKFASAMAQLGVGLVAVSGAMKILSVVGATVVGLFALMRTGLAGIIASVAGAMIRWTGFTKALSTASGVFGKLFEFMKHLAYQSKTLGFLLANLGRFLLPLGLVAEVITRIATGGDQGVFGFLEGLYEKVKKVLGLTSQPPKEDAAAPEAAAGGPANREQVDALKAQRAEIENVTKTLRKQNDEVVRSLGLEASYMKMSEDSVEVAKVQREVYDRAIEAITELQNKKAGLKDEEKALAVEIDKQIAAINNSIMADQVRAETAVRNLQAMRNAQEAFARSIEDTRRAYTKGEALTQLQEELSLIGLYGEELDKQTKLNEINRDLRQQMFDLSMKLLELDAQAIKLGQEKYDIERQRIIQQMQDVQELSNARIKAFEQEQARKQEIEQSYYEGAKKGLRDIAEQFKPINMAQEAVKKGWGAIDDAIDNFVQTGKFKFSDFARSIVADLAKMIAKALIFRAISGFLGGMGIPLPGLASGGKAEKGQPYIVGEKGPELFIPGNTGNVVPNNKLGAMGASQPTQQPVVNNYTYNNNISAVDAKSVAALFYENRKSLFGASMAAQKELPYGARG